VGELQEFFVIAKEPRARQGKEKDPGVCGLPELSGFHLMKWFIGAGAEYRRRSQSSAGVQGGSQRSAGYRGGSQRSAGYRGGNGIP
jgi:hypothetical protein